MADLQEFSFDLVSREKPLALFLDIDGTMVEFAATPDEVIVPPTLPSTLVRLNAEAKGALAIVTGRPIPSADRLFAPTQFTMAGLHGGEFRFDGMHEVLAGTAAPDCWKNEAKALAAANPGVNYEEKRFGFSVHYREAPDMGPMLTEAIGQMMMRDNPGFHMMQASMAIEVRPDGIDKGSAILRLMQLPEFAGRHPVFFGDDTTDEDGFRVLQQIGGTPVVVGKRRPPEVRYTVSDPAAMRALLEGLQLT